MIHKLENEFLAVTINSKGAELQSIIFKENNKEYLWNGDAKVWNRRSPILFPIVGRLIENKYLFNGSEYSLTQHGFARDFDFEEIFSSKTEITFILTESDATLIQFPFQFVLFVTYKLEEKKVRVEYEVKNTSENETMYYSIGAHPGIVLHERGESTIEDYLIEFEQYESMMTHVLEGAYRNGDLKAIKASNSNQLQLNKDTFKGDALIFNGLKSKSLRLSNQTTRRAVKVAWRNFGWLGIWSKHKSELFVCIEPWAGVCDKIGQVKDLKEKEGIEVLNPKLSKSYEFAIEILD